MSVSDSVSARRLALVGGLLVVAGLAAAGWWRWRGAPAPIRVGILHSMTGPMAISERSMVDGEQLAIEEINATGGLLGRPIQSIVADGKSDWPTFAAEAERLITSEKVVTVFGCWTSACRKTVRPVFERLSHLLVYPMAYEGLEQSPNIIYTGAAPNQQITPAVKWGVNHLGRRIFLVGSDYVWPHSINAILKDQIKALGAELVGEEYIFFGSTDVARAVNRIKAARPDMIFSAVVGDSNLPFYQVLRAAGLTAKTSPVISFSIGEEELRSLKTADLDGHYAAWPYFQSLDRPTNRAFVERFRRRYGQDRVTGDVIEASYFSVLLWAQAVRESGSDDVARITKAMLTQSIDAPEGIVSVDAQTHHTWRPVSIGQIDANGRIDVVWTAARSIRPVPYPASRTRAEWDAFLDGLYASWGHTWANPNKQ